MLPPNTRIWLVAGVTDMRRGFDGLAGLVQIQLQPIRSAAMCLSFEVDAAIASRYCGLTGTACACFANVWRLGVLSGLKPTPGA